MLNGVQMVRRGRYVRRIAMAALLTLSFGASLRAELTVDSWDLASKAAVLTEFVDAMGNGVPQIAGLGSPDPVVLPFTLTDTATATVVTQVSRSQSVYDFSVDGDTGVFSFGFDHLSDPSFGSFASSKGTIVFTPAVDSVFALTGDYARTGIGTISLDVSVSEFGVGGASLFQSVQTNAVASTAALPLGNATRSLQAGVTYSLLYEFRIDGANSPQGFTALGDLGLSVTPQIVAVPAPAAAALALVGFAMIGLRRRQHR